MEIAKELRVTLRSLEAHNFLDVRNGAQTSWQAKHVLHTFAFFVWVVATLLFMYLIVFIISFPFDLFF